MRAARLAAAALLLIARTAASQTPAPTWMHAGRLAPMGNTMVARLLASAADGLDPASYGAPRLDSLARALATGAPDSAATAELDRNLTRATVQLLRDLRSGRAPQHPVSLAGFSAEQWDAEMALARALSADTVPKLIEAARPPFRQYRRLEQALAIYRGLASLPPPLPASALRPGMRFDGAATLSRYLEELGDLEQAAAAVGDTVYTAALAMGVRRFQERHALEPDGIIGTATAAAMQIPLEERARQIALAMERLRWLPRITGERFIVVNVPAFELFAFDSAGGAGAPALQIRVIVGGAVGRRTPQLFERIRFVEFHPYWNVPASILANEVLPRVRRNPGYLRANHMEIIGAGDRVLGDAATPALIGALAAGRARVRQRPGEDNALGPVKLIFPNRYDIYLHGTPAPALFAETRRDLSHGCIRVEDPAALTAWVLRDEPGWGPPEVERAMAGATTERVPVASAPPVFIDYTTAIVDSGARVKFYPDVYGRDRQLSADPRMRLPRF